MDKGYTLKDFIGILLLIIIFALIPLGVYLISKQTVFFSKADVSIIPAKIKISNISENSVTVSWITAGKPTLGFISFDTNPDLDNAAQNTKITLFDDRDTDVRVARFTHYVTLKNLTPQTKYYFKIGSGDTIFDNNGVSYEVTTAPISLTPLPLLRSLSGKIMKKDGSILNEAVLYFTTEDGYLMSTIARGDGWSLVLNKARKNDLSGYKELGGENKIDLVVETENGDILKKNLQINDAPEAFQFSL